MYTIKCFAEKSRAYYDRTEFHKDKPAHRRRSSSQTPHFFAHRSPFEASFWIVVENFAISVFSTIVFFVKILFKQSINLHNIIILVNISFRCSATSLATASTTLFTGISCTSTSTIPSLDEVILLSIIIIYGFNFRPSISQEYLQLQQ